MPEINESKLKEQIQRGQMGNLYFLYGEEKMLIRRDLLRMTKKLDDTDFPEFNFNSFPHNAAVDDIADAAEALPFMANHKCVTVSDLNVEALSAAEQNKLMELVENVPESTVLIFALPTLEIDPKKSAKWRNFIKKIDAAGFSISYARRSESDLVKYLCREAEKAGCTLSRTLADKIIRYAGTDLNTLA
ncbi:MAG: DNA polymerase III subunit delta, partial [Clostridia bacterium]|nr:DNA polymerase III subunit delta [Clostridia bacterium]